MDKHKRSRKERTLAEHPAISYGATDSPRRSTQNTMIHALEGRRVRAASPHFIAPTAVVIGDVTIGPDSSIWWGAVLRGDYDRITIGARSNVQDNAVVHMDEGFPVTIGDNVTIGHKVVLHGCTIGDNSLVGINSVVMNDVTIGRDCLIGSNALITEGKTIPDRSLVIGSPGKVVRELSDEQVAEITDFADRYVRNLRRYLTSLEAQASADPA